MEQDKDVYRDWVIVVSDGRNYVGELVEREHNWIKIKKAFELKILEMRRPSPTGQGIEMVLQNMHVQEPLCLGGVSMELYITKIRYFTDLTDVDRREHYSFVESAERAFMMQRAKTSGIELIGSA